MNKFWIALLVLVIALGSAMILRYQQPSPTVPPFNFFAQIVGRETEGFASVKSGWQYVFPNDYGAHPDFQTDAWYFMGHLTTAQGQDFGFQMSFVRVALTPEKPHIDSPWASNEIYRAHVAITDVGHERFHASERFSRVALGLAGAAQPPVRVWLRNWEMRMPDQTRPHFQLTGVTKDIRLSLDLKSVKQVITNVETGTGNPLFHGYWLPRLQASGVLQVGASTYTVNGLATLIQVWGGMSQNLGQLAINCFVLQLDDNREILLFQLRRRDGSAEPISTGILITPSGDIRQLRRQQLTMDVLDLWQSAEDGARYPARWRLHIPEEDLQLEITPILENQELNLSVRYWTGVVRITGKSAGHVVSGTGQVGLTAYAPDTSQL